MSNGQGSTNARRLPRLPGTAFDLAALRIAVFGALILQTLMWQGTPSWFASLPEALRQPPPGWRAVGGLPFASPIAVALLEAGFVVVCLLAAAGWFTRTTTVVATLLGLYLLGLPQSFGKLNHYHHLLWIAALLAASPCSDGWSLDRARRGATAEPQPHSAYGLPLRVTWVLIGLMYLFPGLWKVVASPAGWLSGRDLVGHLHAKWHELEGFRPFLPIDQWPLLTRTLSWFTLAFELSFLPLVLWRRARPWVVGGGLLFHVGTTLTMRISFLPLVACYVAFLDWGAIRAKWRRRIGRDAPGAEAGPSLSVWPAAVAGAVVLCGATLAGALGHDGWPFAVYPRFHYRPPAVVPVVRAERQMPGEAPKAVADPAFVDQLHSSRWAAIARSLISPANTLQHAARVEAVTRLYLDDGLRPSLRPCERLTVFLDLDRTHPAAADENPLRRRVLQVTEKRPQEGCTSEAASAGGQPGKVPSP
ncbi:MAG TPA: HTTM domain-containing protein [Thermoanaerobaculia bacterium]|nr:HTTM domain-containing protein [Thermoanaerobaculia bacterium]